MYICTLIYVCICLGASKYVVMWLQVLTDASEAILRNNAPIVAATPTITTHSLTAHKFINKYFVVVVGFSIQLSIFLFLIKNVPRSKLIFHMLVSDTKQMKRNASK